MRLCFFCISNNKFHYYSSCSILLKFCSGFLWHCFSVSFSFDFISNIPRSFFSYYALIYSNIDRFYHIVLIFLVNHIAPKSLIKFYAILFIFSFQLFSIYFSLFLVLLAIVTYILILFNFISHFILDFYNVVILHYVSLFRLSFILYHTFEFPPLFLSYFSLFISSLDLPS